MIRVCYNWFPIGAMERIARALDYKGIVLVQMTPEIAVLSTRRPGSFHKDPADSIIVASCLVLGAPLLTLDQKIRAWGHVQTIA